MIENIIFVEDGSVDVDELIDSVSEKTKIIIYRQGSNPPKIQALEKPIETSIESILTRETIEKETAKDIISYMMNCIVEHGCCSKYDIIRIADKYGVGIENG